MDAVVATGELRICGEFARVFTILGKRWTGLVLDLLLTRPARFCELASAIPGISDRVLTERLRELEHEGFVDRVVDTGPPISVTYSLSERGQNLRGVVESIHAWAAADRAWLDATAVSERRSTNGAEPEGRPSDPPEAERTATGGAAAKRTSTGAMSR